MFEPLIWMFKIPEFKKHFVYLVFIGLLFTILSIASLFLTYISNFFTDIVLMVIFVILTIIPALCVTGYFWCLTYSIINREEDVQTKSIFDGKIKKVTNITLPELNFGKFLWRGIASIFATILLYLPVVMICITIYNNLSGFNVNEISILCILLFVAGFIPALLWNYARRDSIVAVLNFPKAVYIVGNYLWKYILNILLFIVYSIAYYALIYLMVNLLGLDISTYEQHSDSFQSIVSVPLMVFYAFNYIISIYWLFITAFLLGTIAPPNEA